MIAVASYIVLKAACKLDQVYPRELRAKLAYKAGPATRDMATQAHLPEAPSKDPEESHRMAHP